MQDIAKLIIRIGFGGMMLVHGIGKIGYFFAGGEIQFPNPLGIGEIPTLLLAIFAEVICAAAIVVGFKAKFATIPLIITMLVAAFVVHAHDPLASRELALLYLFGFGAIAMLGPGKYSLDKK